MTNMNADRFCSHGTKLMREAAQRLSAPAAASEYGLEVADAQDSAASAPAREGLRGTIKDKIFKMIKHGDKDHQRWLADKSGEVADAILALSTPPAASADERTELNRDILAWCEQEDIGFLYARALANYLAQVGYRKLAPAQSVGQSAAQGVGEFAAELEKWCEGQKAALIETSKRWGAEAHRNADARGWEIQFNAEATGVEMVLATIRRLSALPKGQEHEG